MTHYITAENAFIFRITHIDNARWILRNGLYCQNGPRCDPAFRSIGNRELIEQRHQRSVLLPPGGALWDYIPFYFTPFSPMAFNIKTGYRNIDKIDSEDLVILVASLRNLVAQGVTVLFTDRHAYLKTARFFDRLDDLDQIDWPLLRNRDFRKTTEDPERVERYQAEALIYKSLPANRLRSIICYCQDRKTELEAQAREAAMDIEIVVTRECYF